VDYDFEPQKNLAVARNRAAVHAKGDFVAFIDDDEFPVKEWLWELFGTCRRLQTDGVLGPVRPHFETPPPAWLLRSGVCNRPAHPTGLVLDYNQTRTGNVLLSRRLFDSPENHFNPEFATHGEDRDFFKRVIGKGHKFVWCEEAVAYETVPPARWKRRYYIRRALLRGSVSWRNTRDRSAMLGKTVAAIAIYTLALPFIWLGGQGLFMKYFLKNCDHLGRFLAVCGLQVERIMKMP
jgi:glycosyltransferase involved in cell wall biosynthesis